MQRKVSLYIAASLDGYIARRDGSVDWLPSIHGGQPQDHSSFLAGIDTVVMGRRTYDAARALDGTAPFAGRECVVFSRKRAGMRANRVRFIADDPAETLRSLRSEPGRGIWLVGGGEIVRECLDSGQVGEVIISLVPVLLGDGVPLFLPRAGTTWLNLRGTRGLANGVVQLTYDMRARRKIEPLEDAPVEMRLRDQRSREAAAAVGAGMVRSWSVRASAA